MKKESTQEKGFITWLDFAKVHKHNVDLLARPEIIPQLPEDGKSSTKISKLIDAARVTSSVAATMLHNCRHNYLDRSHNRGLTIVEVTDDFQTKILSAQEYDWYSARKTWENVVDISKVII